MTLLWRDMIGMTVQRFGWITLIHTSQKVYKVIGIILQLFEIPEKPPENLTNEQFVEYLYTQVINEPDDAFGYEATKLVRDLNIGAIVDHGIIEQIDKQKIFDKYKLRAQNNIVVEKIRSGMATINQDPFIQMANQNDNN